MPTTPRSRSSLTIAAALALLALLCASHPAAAAAPRTPSAASALRTLVTQTTAFPRTAINRAKRNRLRTLARQARGAARARPCTAVRRLVSYRRTLRTTPVRRAAGSARRRAQLRQRLARLGTQSMTASRSLLASSRTRRCGGGVRTPAISQTRTSVLRSDANGMKLRVQLPALRFVPAEGGGRTWTRLALPNTDVPSAEGTPGIPVSSSILAVPDGATMQVKATKTTAYTIDGVEVYPAQPQPVDQAPAGVVLPAPDFFKGAFSQRPFTIDRSAYARRGNVPAAPAFGVKLGDARDLHIAGLHVPAAQYDPSTDTLEVLTQVELDVTFTGGTKTFSDALGSPWETAQAKLAGALLNRDVVRRIERPIVFQPCGEELLVITNPATRPQAEIYAATRRAAGWRTTVRETGASPVGTTPTQIQAFIRARLNHPACIRPSYVTIIGDDELVPTFTATPGAIPSDNPYSTKNDADELPDVAVGRILGNDAAQLSAAIGKIIAYGASPPAGPMLTRATLAAQFQDTDEAGEVNDGQEDRTFIQFAETVRSGLVARGVVVDRIYDDAPATQPLRFNDGTDLPASLKKPTFAWDGDAADVSAAWNQGRFMVVHRDHGWSDGWGHPFFTTDDVDALTNGANLPVVLSINCSSGAYDYDETSFAQNALVKPDGGAVGVFGDTRDSPSWHNSQIALGFVDALLPSVLAGEGPSAKQRTGDALVHGKLRLAGLAPPSGPGISGGSGSTRNELYLWHYFGDPTMRMWGGGGSPPLALSPRVFRATYRELPIPRPGDPPPFLVELTFPSTPRLIGQPVSLVRNGEVIGKALAGDGSVAVAATFNDGPPKQGELELVVEGDDVVPVTVPVDAVPLRATTLSQQCPSAVTIDPQTLEGGVTVGGSLAGAPAGSTVSVRFEAGIDEGGMPEQVIERQVTTDAGGSWTATAPVERATLGQWRVSSSYAGGPGLAPSSAGPCSVLVQLPG